VTLVVLPDAWPRAFFADGSYLPWAKLINVVGGLGFLASAAFFLRRYHRDGGTEELVFANHCLLFGVAGLLFGVSHLWGAIWWLFHVLRLLAYLVVIRHVVQVYRGLQAAEEAGLVRRLEPSEAQMRLVTDALPVLVSFIQRDGRYAYVNRGYTEWFGLAREQVLHRPVPEVIGEAAYTGVRQFLERALAGESVSYERAMPYQHGGARHIRASYMPQRSAGGEVEGVVALVTDITAEKRAQERAGRLQAVTSAISRALTPEDVARAVLAEAAESMGAGSGTFFVLEPEGDSLRLLYAQGLPVEVVTAHETIPLETPLPIASVARSGPPLWLESPKELLRLFPGMELLQKAIGNQSWAVLPLLGGSGPLGALMMGFPRPHSLGAEKRAFLLALGQQVSQAIERANLYLAAQAAVRVPGPGAGQPPHQRGQVRGGPSRARAGGGGGRLRAAHRPGRGHRHHARGAAAPLRPVRARGVGSPVWRPRPGPLHLAPARRGDGRPRVRGQPARGRRHLHRRAATPARTGRGRAGARDGQLGPGCTLGASGPPAIRRPVVSTTHPGLVMRRSYRLTRTLMLCLAGLSCSPDTSPSPTPDADPSTTTAQPLLTSEVAVYDATLSALLCDTPGALCDSTQYLVGRGAVGPEANAPNTLGANCPDGDIGAFHSEASVDAIRVSHPTKAVFSEQKAVRVEADVWGLPSGGSSVMFFQAADARNPQWVHVTTLSATGGAQTLSTTYTLPTGGMQAVRVTIVDAAQAQNVPCTPGDFHDHDDLAFAVAPVDITRPTIVSVSPAAGSSVSNQVTLSANVSDDQAMGRVDFLINNTLVGSDSSAPYSVTWDSFSATNNTEVTYTVRAVDAVGNSSPSSSVNLYVRNDMAAPTVGLIAPKEGATVGGWVSVVANASDDRGVTRVEFYLDDVLIGTSTMAQYGTSWNTQTASGGPHTLTARAYDASGKMTVSTPVNITVDPPPTAVVSSPAEGSVLEGSVSLTATVTDNLGVTRVDFRGQDNSILCNAYSPSYSCSWYTRSSPNGPFRVRAEAYDGAGNQTLSAWAHFTLNNDLTRPTVALTSPTEGTTLRGTVVVSADASDDRGVTQVNFYAGTTLIGTDRTAPFTVNWSSFNVPNGTYALKAQARDAAFNMTDSTLVNVTVDNERVPPTVAFTSPTEGATLYGWATLSVTASDDQSGISKVEFYRGTTLLTTDTTAPYAYDVNTRTLANGAYAFTAKAYDGVGNLASTTVNVTLDNDFVAPTVSFASPTEGATLTGTATLSVNATDDRVVSRVEFYLGSTLLSTDTGAPYAYSLNTRNHTNGPYSLVAKAYDATGNVGSSTVNVTLRNDLAAPSVTLTSPANNATLSGTVFLAATASDDIGVTKVEFVLDSMLLGSDTTSPYSMNWYSGGATPGYHYILAKAYDAAGNVTHSNAANVTISSPPPPPPPSTTATYSSTLRVPRCSTVAASCDSGTLLDGRAGLGPESNAPNTLGSSCADGTYGTYHNDESVDAITVKTLDGSAMAPSKTVRIEVTVWAYSSYTSDKLDLYFTGTAANPSWTYITTLTPSFSGNQMLSATYTLPPGTTQAVRARFRFGGSVGSCGTGSYDDHDDLAFSVGQ
jgi:PAS domain S-box-containing protein